MGFGGLEQVGHPSRAGLGGSLQATWSKQLLQEVFSSLRTWISQVWKPQKCLRIFRYKPRAVPLALCALPNVPLLPGATEQSLSVLGSGCLGSLLPCLCLLAGAGAAAASGTSGLVRGDESLLFLSMMFCTCLARGSRLMPGQRLHLKAKPCGVQL